MHSVYGLKRFSHATKGRKSSVTPAKRRSFGKRPFKKEHLIVDSNA